MVCVCIGMTSMRYIKMKPDISDSPTHLWAPESVSSWSLPSSSVSVDLVDGAEAWVWV